MECGIRYFPERERTDHFDRRRRGCLRLLLFFYLAIVRKSDDRNSFVGLDLCPLKNWEMGGFNFFPYILPRLKLYLSLGDHLANRKASLLCLGSHFWKTIHHKQERYTEEIYESFFLLFHPLLKDCKQRLLAEETSKEN